MPSRGFRRPFRQLYDFDRGCIVKMREAGWSYRAVGRHLTAFVSLISSLASKVNTSFTNRTCLGHGRVSDSGTPKYHRSGTTTDECLS
ncbi:hypothetical protein TNCV_4689231 [Trichonephila clavipes]|nr:hypothetical protein TNCV_4689231 [Trichonephila clavipes]